MGTPSGSPPTAVPEVQLTRPLTRGVPARQTQHPVVPPRSPGDLHEAVLERQGQLVRLHRLGRGGVPVVVDLGHDRRDLHLDQPGQRPRRHLDVAGGDHRVVRRERRLQLSTVAGGEDPYVPRRRPGSWTRRPPTAPATSGGSRSGRPPWPQGPPGPPTPGTPRSGMSDAGSRRRSPRGRHRRGRRTTGSADLDPPVVDDHGWPPHLDRDRRVVGRDDHLRRSRPRRACASATSSRTGGGRRPGASGRDRWSDPRVAPPSPRCRSAPRLDPPLELVVKRDQPPGLAASYQFSGDGDEVLRTARRRRPTGRRPPPGGTRRPPGCRARRPGSPC